MPALESPLWLLTLLCIPLVWWIHRFRNQGDEISVSTVMLWKNITQLENNKHKLTTADPLWQLRAIIVTALIFALTTPFFYSQSNRSIDVWFDHSLSMHTVEGERSRIELGIQKLLDALDREEITEVLIRSLQDPSRSLQLTLQNRHALQQWLNDAPQTASQSLPISSIPEHEAWLVTDGANNKLQHWVTTTKVDRVIQVGSTTENTALTRLSVRPSLTETNFAGIASISNHGHKTATRKLQIETEDKILHEWPVTLQPGETVHRTFTIAQNSSNLINARLLEPEDALEHDDKLSLSTQETTIAITGNCGKPMQALLQALPGIRVSTSASAALTIICADEQPLLDGTTIWFRTGGETQQINEPPYWSTSANLLSKLTLQPTQLLAHLTQTPALGEALLTAGGVPLISFQSAPKRLMEVRLDIHKPQLTEHPTFPVLITGLMEYALGEQLLDQIYTVQHPPLQSQIKPKVLKSHDRVIAGSHAAVSNLAHWFIIAALLLLLFDLLYSRGMRR